MLFDDLKKIKHRGHLPSILKKHNLKVLCELGLRSGNHFKSLMLSDPELIIGVDIWNDDGINSHNDAKIDKDVLEYYYINLMKEFILDNRVRFIRDYTDKAHNIFNDGFFDFVYVDAEHTYNGCYMDCVNWYKKIKVGGVLAGDDYDSDGKRWVEVTRAVNSFVDHFHIDYFHGDHNSRQWYIIKT